MAMDKTETPPDGADGADGLSSSAATQAETRRRIWRAENRQAMASWNSYVEANGIPLAQHRQF
jgi:post-segregation antitoxin (ccd killing protein)